MNDHILNGQLLGLIMYCHAIQQTIQGLDAKRLRENQEELLHLLQTSPSRNESNVDVFNTAYTLIRTIKEGSWDDFLSGVSSES